ncbi:MAG: electron transport complex subunit RsxG [Oceanococcus sp.]
MSQEVRHQALISAGVLATFAVIGSAILATANWLTADRIAENERLAMLRQLQEILPAGSYDNALLQDTLSVTLPASISPEGVDTLYIARRQNTPVAVIIPATAPNGYNGAIDLLIGIHADGRIAAVRVSKHRETPGLGDGIDKSRGDWIDQFDGRAFLNPEKWAVRKDGGPFDQLTGATITPRAIVKTVHGTLAWFKDNQASVMSDE